MSTPIFPRSLIGRIGLVFVLTSTAIFAEQMAVSGKPGLDFKAIRPHINTAGSEFSPTVSADGQTMIFNKKGAGQRYFDLYISAKVDGEWQKEAPLSQLNSPYSDEAPYLSADGKYLFFSSDRDGSLEMPKNSQGQIRVSYDLYWSQKTPDGWSAPQKIPGRVNTIHHERSPSFDVERMTLFYSMWPFGDFKKSRIMSSKWNGSAFEAPQELPATVNSGNMEAGFTPAGNNKGYYFASKRADSLGGWDIYYTAWHNNTYQPAINMGPQINTKDNEIYLLSRAGSAYLCSDREGGAGEYDIFSTDFLESRQLIVVNKKTRQPVAIQARISYDNNTKVVHSDKKGILDIQFDKHSQPQVRVRIQEKGFLPYDELVLPRTNNKIELEPIEKDHSFIVKDIHFDYNSAVIKSESLPVLDDLTGYLRKNPQLRLEIIGHTDRHASASYNQELSLNRAKAVRDYLKSQKLAVDGFLVKGAGFSSPLSKANNTEADRLNRRTEFRILSSE